MMKRLLLLVGALILLWLAFFRRRPVPVVMNQGIDPSTGRVVGTSENIKATANQAVANTVAAAGQATASGTSQILGTIFNGVAQSISQYGFGGSQGADTNSGAGGYGGSSDPWPTDDYTEKDALSYSDSGAIDTTI